VITGLNTSINAFDLTLNYDTRVLSAVLIDQSGLMYGGNNGCPGGNPSCTLSLAFTINQLIGEVHVSQALIGVTSGPGGTCNNTTNPSCTSVNQELFRIRFDIIGAGTGFINFSSDPLKNAIQNPASVKHTTLNSGLSTNKLFALIDAVNSFRNGYNASWTFSPNPELPSSSLTFTATSASCGNCTLPFSYFWDFSSLDAVSYVPKVDATGQTITITPPSPVVNRVTLTVRDAASHSVNATRRLPLNAIVTGPTTVAQGVTSTAFTGKWLGGVVTGSSGYSGQWRFCPGTVVTHPVCSRGPILISQNPGAINQTSRVSSVTWNFAGLYNDFMSISDTAVGQISPTPNTVIAPIPVNVTGNTPAYIVTVNPSVLYVGAGQSVNFSITVAYDPSYPTASQSAQFKYLVFGGDGRPPDSFTGTNSVSHLYTYSRTGSYVAKVVVQEISNNAPSMIQEIGYSPPLMLVASFVFTPPVVWLNRGGVSLPSSPVVGDTISFNATVLGGDAPYAYSWNFGDGTTGSGSSISHKYSLAGDYKVSLTVTDSKSKISSVVHIVSIASSQAAELPVTYIAGAGIAAAVVAAGLLLFLRRRKTVGPTVGGPTV
jgi:hypothetical protein